MKTSDRISLFVVLPTGIISIAIMVIVLANQDQAGDVKSPLVPSAPLVERSAIEPTSTEPAPTEPAPTEPAPTEPAPTEPAPTEPTSTEPAPTEPATNETAILEKINPIEVRAQELLVGTWNSTAPTEWAGDVLAFDKDGKVTDEGMLANPSSPSLFYSDSNRNGDVTYQIHQVADSSVIHITTKFADSEEREPFEQKFPIVSIEAEKMVILKVNAINGAEVNVTYQKLSNDPRHFYPKE